MNIADWSDGLVRDIRYACRSLLRSPSFAIIAVTSLALGAGLNSAIFSIANIALFKSLPVNRPDELVILSDSNASSVMGGLQTGNRFLLSFSEFVQLRDRTKTLSGLTAFQLGFRLLPIQISQATREEARAQIVSENYFSVLGIKPVRGRYFTQQDAAGVGQDPYAVLAYNYWQHRFGGSPDVIGKSMRFYNTSVTVIGVAPPTFHGTVVGQEPDFWLPMMMQPFVMPGMDQLHQDADTIMWLHVFGRLAPKTTIAQVQAEMNLLLRQILEVRYKRTMSRQTSREFDQHIIVRKLGAGVFSGRDEFFKQWTLLATLAGLVEVIASANVAVLLLSRAMVRSREIAIRFSVGAKRGRLIRQLITESLLLASLGGAAGTFLAVVALRLLPLHFSNGGEAFELTPTIDLNLAAFSAGVVLLSGVLFGIAPAFIVSRSKLSESMKGGGQERLSSTTRALTAKAMVAAQLALSFALIMGAGIFLRTVWNLQRVDLGYPRGNLMLIDVEISGPRYHGQRLVNLYNEISYRSRAIPGVRSISWSSPGPFSGEGAAFGVTVENFNGRTDDDRGARGTYVGQDYFSTLGIPIVLGRAIEPRDVTSSPRVCVINEAFMKRFFPGINPIGKYVKASVETTEDTSPPRQRSMIVIGVAKDIREHSLRDHVIQEFYFPAQFGSTLEVRTAGDPRSLRKTLVKTITDINPDLQVTSAKTLDEVVESRNERQTLVARLCMLFGILALILVATGIYGVLSYTIARRTSEIGIRMALGASKEQLIGMILKETGVLVLTGIAAGLAVTLSCARLASSQLYGADANEPIWSFARYQRTESGVQLFGVNAMDPLTMIIAVVILTLVAMIAGYVPAARAGAVDPLRALRHQ